MKWVRKSLGMAFLVLAVLVQTAWAAEASHVANVRYSQRPEAVRIVFDFDRVPEHEIRLEQDGTVIVIDMPDTFNQSGLLNLALQDETVKSVVFSEVEKNTFRTTITLKRNVAYKVDQLQNPSRFYIDIIKNYDQKFTKQVAPGIVYSNLIRGNSRGLITAHVLNIDPALYHLKPALANGVIAGRQKLSSIAKETQAVAAVNASYFAPNGEILGLTKIDSAIVSTAGLKRSAFGVLKDGTPVIGQVDYKGTVKLRSGEMLPIGGVNVERGENALVLYNEYYGPSTKTNAYGREFYIKAGDIAAIHQNNSPLKKGDRVVSAHGASAAKLANLQVGQDMEIIEDLGDPWNQATDILGVGPMLIKDGSIYLSTKEEQFGSDVAGGRAPRTAVGITGDGRVLLAVVDGRQSHSIGYTLLELALFMQEQGAVQAVNFDGGGSSEMIIGADIVNQPSDGSERQIGAALVILPK